MGFLNWMKKQERAPEPETETGPPFGLTKKGNPIEPVRSSDWQSDPVGVHETRTHIGKSSEGFHGGFQVVPAGGDGDIRWSNARKTEAQAGLAAGRMSERREKENAQTSLDFESHAIPQFERENRGQSQIVEESRKPSRPQSK